MSAERDVDVLVVGGGPSGLAAAVALRRAGVDRVEVVDREQEAGGVPRHCHHTGFGLRDLHRVMSGPQYAKACVAGAEAAGVRVRPGVTVTGWGDDSDGATRGTGVVTTSPSGVERVRSRAVVLATGARERPRTARMVPGDRGDGVLTTGQLQQMVYLHGLSGAQVGTRAVVVGAEHVSFSALMTLDHAGVAVAAMVTDQPRHQSWPLLAAAARLRYRVPLIAGARVECIVGRRRVESVQLRCADGSLREIVCDSVVFTGDWIPDHELARRAGIELDAGSRGPRVDMSLQTSRPGVFAVGNLVHPALTADVAALTGQAVARGLLGYLRTSGTGPGRGEDVAVVTEAPLAWVFPGRLEPDQVGTGRRPPRGVFVGWSREVVQRPELLVRQGNRTLATHRPGSRLMANRPFSVPADWIDAVAADGGPVTVSVTRRG